jgi:hypothetical protein
MKALLILALIAPCLLFSQQDTSTLTLPTKALRQIALELHQCDSIKAQHQLLKAENKATMQLVHLQQVQLQAHQENTAHYSTENQRLISENARLKRQRAFLLGAKGVLLLFIFL